MVKFFFEFVFTIGILATSISSGCGKKQKSSDNSRSQSQSEKSQPSLNQDPAIEAKRPNPRPAEEGEGMPTFLVDNVTGQSICDAGGRCTTTITGNKAVLLVGRDPHQYEVLVYVQPLSSASSGTGLNLNGDPGIRIIGRMPINANGSFSFLSSEFVLTYEIGLALVMVGSSSIVAGSAIGVTDREGHLHFSYSANRPPESQDPGPSGPTAAQTSTTVGRINDGTTNGPYAVTPSTTSELVRTISAEPIYSLSNTITTSNSPPAPLPFLATTSSTSAPMPTLERTTSATSQ